MNTHLKNSFVSVGRIMFTDLQEHRRTSVKSAFEKASDDPTCVQFWDDISSFFKNNDASRMNHGRVPCDYIEDSPSAGRHRQHCYINDAQNNRFQIYTLTHRENLLYPSDSLPIGAIAEGMLKNNISGVDSWFDDFSDFANKELISSLKCLLDDTESMPSLAISMIKEFYSAFFFWNVYSHDKKISDFNYRGILDLDNLLNISKNINSNNLTNFKTEIKKIISNN